MTSDTRLRSKQISIDQQHLPEFSFIDLFAGIGGMRLAFQRAGGSCVFSSEWDRFARLTYEANFHDVPAGDIHDVDISSIPDHQVLLAGFPCQPFSLAGVSKNNALGRKHGFEHPTQGTLFYEIVKILDQHRPQAFLLENVKNIQSHDQKRTFKEILRTLREELGYRVKTEIIDARHVVPQHRERTYIVGFKDTDIDFKFPTISLNGTRPTLKSILEEEPDPKYSLSAHLWQYLQDYAAKHKAKGNGFGFGLVDPNDLEVTTRTLSARYHKDGSEILIDTGRDIFNGGGTPRRLTPKECAKLMGFPKSFVTDEVSDTQAYRQFGNSVVVPVVEQIAKAMGNHLKPG